MGNVAWHFFNALQRLVLLLVLCFSINLKGQVAQFSFNKITVADNLSSQTDNEYIFCDSEHFLWISSTLGLNRFDGKTVRTYLPEENIQSMFFEDKQRRVWFSTYTGIFCYERENDRFQTYHLKHEKTGEEIRENYQLLYVDSTTNYLWVYIKGENKLYKFNPFDGDQISLNIRIFNINSEIKKVKNGSGLTLIFPDGNGLKISDLTPNTDTTTSIKILQDYNVSSFYLEHDTSLWVGVDSALIEYDLTANLIKKILSFDGKLIPSVQGIVDPGDGNLIISTSESGMFILKKETGNIVNRIYSYEDGKLVPFVNPINQIYLDPNNNLWIASYGNGIFFINLNKPKIKRYLYKSDEKQDANNNVKAISENSKGLLYCLTENNIEVVKENGETFQIDRPKILEQNAKPFYLFCDKGDNLWLFSNYGLLVKRPTRNHFEIVPIAKKGNQEGMTYVSQLFDSTLLISSYHSGLYEVKEYNGAYFLEKYLKLGESNGAYTLSFEDSKGQLFLCHEQRNIFIYKKGDSNYIPMDTIPFQGFITGIIDDPKRGILWLSTQIGLYKLKHHLDDTFSIQKDTIFPVNAVNGILLDSLYNLWVSTNNGLFRYFSHSNPDSIEIRKYSIADGLQSREFFFWSALKTSAGLFAFGGVNGINIFNPYEIEDIKTQARPIITGIKINGEPPKYQLKCDSTGALNISEIHKLVFESTENSLNISVAALEYSDPSSNEFRYKMNKGKNDTWIYNGTDHTINLSFLSPGYYDLLVDAANSDGIWSENPHRLQIRIKPPWYKTWQAYSMYILLTASLIFAYYRNRITQIRKEEAFKRKESEYKQLVAETETAILRLQMNPHFIFNSMNSISSYILQKDIETANDYLARFAKLMRMILKFAAKPFIAVANEIELLELYLQTEAMRFEKRFDYKVDLPDGFDPDEFIIPTMILQPFVENAIWHGLSAKKEKGHILISFWQEDKYLCCSIADNGVGRAASTTRQQTKTHESKALSLTERRLELLESKDGMSSSFEIQDLYDNAQKPAGTKVLLRFPVF